MTTRTYALVVACVAFAALLVAVAFVWVGAYSLAQLLWRWTIAVAILGGSIWAFDRMRGLAERATPERLPLLNAAAGCTGIAVYLPTLAVMMYGTAVGHHAVGLLWLVPFMFGFSLAASGWRRRVGTSKHCPHCEYECGILDPDRVPIQCPECGYIWLGPMKRGRRVPSRR
ncbi:MAG: hypothetical protein ACKVS8_09645 [Phycisphaerales bacterium]